MAKKDYCPNCGTELVAEKTVRMICPAQCGFVDRRSGNSIVEPLADRREGTNRFFYQKHKADFCPWSGEKKWK